jgi:hypothetical protein
MTKSIHLKQQKQQQEQDIFGVSEPPLTASSAMKQKRHQKRSPNSHITPRAPQSPSSSSSTARNEPPLGSRLFAVWLDPSKDNPRSHSQRFSESLLPTAYHYTQTIPLSYPPPPFEQLDTLSTDAAIYLSLYPIVPFQNITDLDLHRIAYQVLALNIHGRKVFLRPAPDMNTSWRPYGQCPIAFLAFWKRLYDAVRSASSIASAFSNNVNYGAMTAFVWAPHVGAGYPWRDAGYHLAAPDITNMNVRELGVLDTNVDGVWDSRDDPYAPFYPGDSLVDWVGL